MDSLTLINENLICSTDINRRLYYCWKRLLLVLTSTSRFDDSSSRRLIETLAEIIDQQQKYEVTVNYAENEYETSLLLQGYFNYVNKQRLLATCAGTTSGYVKITRNALRASLTYHRALYDIEVDVTWCGNKEVIGFVNMVLNKTYESRKRVTIVNADSTLSFLAQ